MRQKLVLAWPWVRGVLVTAAVVFIALKALHPPAAAPHEDVLAIFEDALPAMSAAVLLAVALLRFGDRVRALVEKVPRWAIDVALLALGMFLALRMTLQAFGAFPQIQDEISYDLLARRIAIGRPVPSSPPLPEFFRMRFLVDDGRSYPLFQPGWPLLMALFYKLRAPALAPAFAVGCLVVGGSRLAERIYGRLTSILAGLLLASSGFVLVVGSAFFAHAWAAALVCLGLERLIAALKEDDPRRARRAAITGGLFGAWLVITRLPTALSFVLTAAIAVAAYSFETFRPRPKLLARAKKPLAAFALAFLVGPLAQAGWNVATTRNPLVLPQDRYFAQTEPLPHCHRIGFGKDVGCPREHPREVPPEGYTVSRAAQVTGMRWSVFRTDAWGTAWPLALSGVFLVRRRLRLRDAVVATGALAPIAVYFGFYYHAIQHGARLWADVMGPLAVLVAAGALVAFERDPDEPERRAPFLHRSLSAAVLALLVLVVHDELTRDIPERIAKISAVRQAERVAHNLDAANVHGAVVYVGNCVEPDRGDVVYGWASVLNAIDPEQGDRLVVRDFGPEHDKQLVMLYPGRKHVRVDCNGRYVSTEPATPRPQLLVTELEAKFPPDDRQGCYATIRALPTASNRQLLEIRASEPNAWARFRQYVFEDGTYELRLTAHRRPDGGRFVLAIDGTPIEGTIDSRGAPELITHTLKPVTLGRGTHHLEVRSAEGPGVFYFSIDRLELHKQ
ncbi:MAG: hypothetical protein HYV09_16950 [Deltaproteobacteria bacterium]|nr:hypothetical protein [Deltaproteobacteria bacterium]